MVAACTAVAMDDPHWTQVDDWLDMSLSSSEMVHVCFNVALLEMFFWCILCVLMSVAVLYSVLRVIYKYIIGFSVQYHKNFCQIK